MDPKLHFTEKERKTWVNQKKAVPDKIMWFISLHVSRGINKSGLSLVKLPTWFGLSVSTLSTFTQHVTYVSLSALKDEHYSQIWWPKEVKQKNMHGFACGFPKCVELIDGTKQKIFYTGDKNEHKVTYCRQHQADCQAAFLWTEIYGLY